MHTYCRSWLKVEKQWKRSVGRVRIQQTFPPLHNWPITLCGCECWSDRFINHPTSSLSESEDIRTSAHRHWSFYTSITNQNSISVQCSSTILSSSLLCPVWSNKQISVRRPLRPEASALRRCPAPCPTSSSPNTGSFEGKPYVRASASCSSSRSVDAQLRCLQPLRTDFELSSHLSFCSLSFSWHPRV